jgi:hypothetical protein
MLSLAKFVKKEIQLRENIVGTGFNDPVRREKPDITDPNSIAKARAREHINPPTRVTCLGK